MLDVYLKNKVVENESLPLIGKNQQALLSFFSPPIKSQIPNPNSPHLYLQIEGETLRNYTTIGLRSIH
jgi:hypothetical protein